jgi:IS30 family transposase
MDLILLEKIKELRCENNGITKIAKQLNKCTDTIRKKEIFENYYKNCKFYIGKLCPKCGENGGYKHGKYKNRQKLTCKYCNNHFYDEII